MEKLKLYIIRFLSYLIFCKPMKSETFLLLIIIMFLFKYAHLFTYSNFNRLKRYFVFTWSCPIRYNRFHAELLRSKVLPSLLVYQFLVRRTNAIESGCHLEGICKEIKL